MTSGSRTHAIQELLCAASWASGRSTHDLVRLAEGLLDIPKIDQHEPPQGWSGLNGDGGPLQLCISLSALGTATRLLADPGYAQLDAAAQRISAAHRVLRCVARPWPRVVAACAEMLRVVGPTAFGALTPYEKGFLWIGSGLDCQGLAVYLSMAPWGNNGWALARRWLTGAVKSGHPDLCIINRLASVGPIASVGIEGGPGAIRMKVYFRIRSTVPLGDLGFTPRGSEAVGTLLRLVLDGRQVRDSGLVCAAGWDLDTGHFVDAKLDVCGCSNCAGRPLDEWCEVFSRLGERLDLPMKPAYEGTRDLGLDIAFIGLGVTRMDELRANVYWKTRTWAS